MRTVISLLVFTLLVCTTAVGQGFYVGGALGSSFQNKRLVNLEGNDFHIKKNGFAWKAFGGIRFGFIGLEGGYRDFGEIEEKKLNAQYPVPGGGTDVCMDCVGTARTKGGDIFAKGRVKIAIIQLFAKAGVFFQRTDRTLVDEVRGGENLLDASKAKLKQAVFAWGVGGGVVLGPVGIQLEWESFEINPESLGMLSLGATLGFGK